MDYGNMFTRIALCMPHKFDATNIKKLEYPERFAEEPFEEILKILPISKFSSILELGCGSGYYTFPLAHFSAQDAKVYALDVELKMLNLLRANMRRGKIFKPLHPDDVKKIIPLLIQENQFEVLDESIDLFFCAKVLHEIEGFSEFFEELTRVMRKNGVVYVLDWKKEQTKQGPPMELRIDMKEAIEMFGKNGVQIDKSGEIFTDYYYLMGKATG